MSNLELFGSVTFTTGAGSETISRCRFTSGTSQKTALRVTIASQSTSNPVATVELRSGVSTGTLGSEVLVKKNPLDTETFRGSLKAFSASAPTSGGTIRSALIVQPGQTRQFSVYTVPGDTTGSANLLDVFTTTASAGTFTITVEAIE